MSVKFRSQGHYETNRQIVLALSKVIANRTDEDEEMLQDAAEVLIQSGWTQRLPRAELRAAYLKGLKDGAFNSADVMNGVYGETPYDDEISDRVV